MPIVRKSGSPYLWYDFRFGGKRYRESTKEKSMAAARAVEAQKLCDLKAGKKPAPGGRVPTLREHLEKFTAFFDNHQQRKPKTKKYYKSGAKLLNQTSLRDLPIDQITTSRVACIAFPDSPSNGNMALRTLSKSLAQAVEWGILHSSPRIHLFEEFGRETTFTADYERRLLAVAPQPLRDVFVILMDQGMRPEEVYRMSWDEVLWDRNTIHVSKGKTKAAKRYIGMSDRVEALLKERVRAQGQAKNMKIATSPWVFPSLKSKSGHIGTINKAFAKARTVAGLPATVVPYSARHTYGTDAMMGTGNQKLVATVMGQSDLKTSARYQHPATEGVGDIINARNQERIKDGHVFGHSGKETVQ
jgi:integrase